MFILRFETKIYNYSADEKIIGAEVTVYDEDGDKIDSIIVTDETQLQRLEEALEVIDETYVQYTSLNSILENLDESTPINATKLNGYQGDAFVLQDDLETILTNPKPHASPNTNYGAGSTSNYGHVKLRDNLNASSYISGEALSSYQGALLKQQIDSLNDRAVKSSLIVLIGRYEDKQGEYGTRIIGQRGVNGVYARIYCDDPNFNASKLILYLDINGVSYEFKASNTDEKRRLYDATDIPGSVVSGRLAIGSGFPTGEHIMTVFCRYLDNTIYPVTGLKRIVVH